MWELQTFYCEGDGRCCIQDEVWTYADDDVCDKFENQDKYAGTIFRQITTSMEVLAPQFIYWDSHKYKFISTCVKTTAHETYEEAIAATLAKLKEVGE